MDTKEIVVKLLTKASTSVPKDVINSLKKANSEEDSLVAKMQYKAILENIRLAGERLNPLCQDTGIHVFYVKLGKYFPQDLKQGIFDGVAEATKEVPLRPNAVHPITRKNSGNNIGRFIPYIHYELTDEEYTEITAMPKGAGSENMSALKMLNPSDGIKGIKKFVIETAFNAGGKPCNPGIIGVGIGGTADIAAKLSKKAILRPVDKLHEEEEIAALEKELTEKVNSLGIGPMGLGGKKSALGVRVEYAYCHTASLPVAITFQCWAARQATARIYPDKVEFLEGGV